jgi:uncharacterized membrane protein
VPRLDFLDLLQAPLDAVGLVLFLLIFPLYHGIYPWLMSLFPERAVKTRIDLYRRSWIERLVRDQDVLMAAQQTRNLTMVNTLLASSALILMGFTANLLIQGPALSFDLPIHGGETIHPAAQPGKLLLLIVVFGASFAYCMTALRHLGHFNVVMGADPHLIDLYEGSAVEYLSGLINRASNRYTMAVRCLYSASPLFLWLFDTRLFVGVTLLWGLKLIGFQDFAFGLIGRRGGTQVAPAAPPPATAAEGVVSVLPGATGAARTPPTADRRSAS